MKNKNINVKEKHVSSTSTGHLLYTLDLTSPLRRTTVNDGSECDVRIIGNIHCRYKAQDCPS